MPDRRARKKLQTHRSLAAAARRLTLERGLDDVTVEDIADAAGVSPRTFFNYFSCKEEAIVGADATVLEAAAQAVRERPAGEDPFTALLAVLLDGEESDLVRRWTSRAELTARHPELLPRHMAAVVQHEQALTAAVADRLGVDPDTDPYPSLVVMSAVTTLRSTMHWWLQNDRPVPLGTALRNAFDLLAAGFVARSRAGTGA